MTEDTNDLVRMQAVCKRYPRFELKDLNLTLPQGQIMGMVGPNGAGKSTTLNLLMGFSKADSGSIDVLGWDVGTQADKIKYDVAHVSEAMKLYAEFDLDWHMRFLARVYPSWDAKYAKSLLQKFDLNPTQRIKEFSLGQRVKATLLLALARRPKLLVLDEPSTGLDPVARHELTDQLIEIMLNEENSVLFSSQFTQDIERLSDRIVFIDDGKIICNTDKEKFFDHWRRVQVAGTGPLPNATAVLKSADYGKSKDLLYNHFSTSELDKLRAQGFEIKQVLNLTLEEIFIEQVLELRRAREAVKNV